MLAKFLAKQQGTDRGMDSSNAASPPIRSCVSSEENWGICALNNPIIAISLMSVVMMNPHCL
jgi:hypothetical protein